MKKLILILTAFFAFQLNAQTTIVNNLQINSATKKNDATRVMVQDSITKKVYWVLKSSITGSGPNDLNETTLLGNFTEQDIEFQAGAGIKFNHGTNWGLIDGGVGLTGNRTWAMPDIDGTFSVISQTVTNGVTKKSPSEDAVYDAIAAAIAGVTGVTNLSYTASSTQGLVVSDTGTDATIPAGSTTNASLMLPADKTKLDAITGTNTGNQTTIVGITGTMAQFDTAVTDGNFVYQSQALGTPSSGTLTNATGLPITTGVSGLGTGVAAFLATPTSANLATAVTNETGSGALVFATSPTLVTPILGTPTSGNLVNCTGLPQSGVTNLVTDLAGKEPTITAGTTYEYWRGDKTWQTFPSLTGFVPYIGATTTLDLGFQQGVGYRFTAIDTGGASGGVSLGDGYRDIDYVGIYSGLADQIIADFNGITNVYRFANNLLNVDANSSIFRVNGFLTQEHGTNDGVANYTTIEASDYYIALKAVSGTGTDNFGDTTLTLNPEEGFNYRYDNPATGRSNVFNNKDGISTANATTPDDTARFTNIVLNTDTAQSTFTNQSPTEYQIGGNAYADGLLYVNSTNGHVVVGDAFDDVNGTKLDVDDAAQTITLDAGIIVFPHMGGGGGTRLLTVDASNVVYSTTTNGLPAIMVQGDDLTAHTSSLTNWASYLVTNNGNYRIGGYLNPTTLTGVNTIIYRVTYTDLNSNTKTVTMPLIGSSGAISTVASSVDDYSVVDFQIRAKSGTTISFATVLTGTGTYDIGSTIEFVRQ